MVMKSCSLLLLTSYSSPGPSWLRRQNLDLLCVGMATVQPPGQLELLRLVACCETNAAK